MEERIRAMICRFVGESPTGRFPESDEPYFDEPLVGYAAADDPLFDDYKRIIGAFHRTPHEVMELGFGTGVRAATVISWILPITQPTRDSNRREEVHPSPAWARTRNFGEQFNAALRRHVTEWLAEQGHRAVAPQLEATWREYPETPVGRASTWSERHAAYAAGLGTFSLNDALITPRGIAHRCGSVITDLPLMPSPRPYPGPYHNCLYYREKSCGACIGRCPAGAISYQGHDKDACGRYVYGTAVAAVAEKYGVTQTGCGLCQTRVPCEGQIPAGTINT
ncbi:epoxyqueuosine reductase [Oryzomonas sagensis]|uniref:Epoxyqueuosine reductase n=1 Tax=Oryzomonas sagensis TaxID=2603857 RepID=A0ABQ6TKP1_9BACT|nr:epoxyqueuosine reductase [Oryzomonas sagensis]KAB0668706.1 epoxyqueuosine reductase [Oryzomonas sagensis]